jgi:hypothetical protein
LQKEKGRFFACAAGATFEKVDKTIAQSECEQSVQPFAKSKFKQQKRASFEALFNDC